MSESSGGPIWILGTGAFGSKALPTGVSEKLLRVSAVYSHIREDRGSWMPEELRRARFVSVRDAYSNLANRIDNYQRVADMVIAGAMQPAEVVYFTYGSPVIYDRVTSLIREGAMIQGMVCHVIPATSSVDALLAFLGEDMAPGLQICEARWLVTNSIALDPKLSALLFQVGAFWTDGIPVDQNVSVARLRPLQNYLLKLYPHFSPAIFARAPLYFGDPGYARGTWVGELAQGGFPADLADTSLFVPSQMNHDRSNKLWWRRYFVSDRDPQKIR